jgi:hypothetical protein
MLLIWFQGSSTLSVSNCWHLEDFVTWVDSSKIKRNIMKYSDKVSTPWPAKLTLSLMISIYYNETWVNEFKIALVMSRDPREPTLESHWSLTLPVL